MEIIIMIDCSKAVLRIDSIDLSNIPSNQVICASLAVKGEIEARLGIMLVVV